MTDILQEIDDALKRERAAKMWKEYGPSLMVGVVALVVFTGGFSFWNHYKMEQNVKRSNLLISALETQFQETALDAASNVLEGQHKSIALFQSAGLKAQDGRKTDAAAQYRTIIADASAPQTLRDLALINAVALDWELGAGEPAALLAEIKPLTARKGPWTKQAALQAALIAAEGMQDYKGALAYLHILTGDETTPATLQSRARALDHLYGMKAALETESKG